MPESIQITILPISFFLLGFLYATVSAQHRDDRHTGHEHYRPKMDVVKNVLKDREFIRDYEHIREDVQDMYNKDFAEKLNDIDMEIFYFQLHDLDKDKRLDGLELLGAMNHVMNREQELIDRADLMKSSETRMALQSWWNEKFEEDAKFIDQVLKEEDLDQDGFLSYMEFAIGRQREMGQI
ncbi:multiple coagulation factor deficiency protein 2 homolog [Uloborus diversus]|uniref:multiple coagulation factor deficiency protein 2 homolog n=1 Tax=Uloborus diversus TaxID=327109 RepID=UPI002409A2F5|nr:multiple coagulation factor deficiency protein 2 homolog [Uloborus diversus]